MPSSMAETSRQRTVVLATKNASIKYGTTYDTRSIHKVLIDLKRADSEVPPRTIN